MLQKAASNHSKSLFEESNLGQASYDALDLVVHPKPVPQVQFIHVTTKYNIVCLYYIRLLNDLGY